MMIILYYLKIILMVMGKPPMIIPLGILNLSPGYAINFHGISIYSFFFVCSQAELAKAYRTLALKYHPVTRRQGGGLRTEASSD